ncbi:MMPL family transporter [Bacillus sp. EAC]|uniref:MMPL family transporter n=1 Tax=Bacillus sp. EAC TaxID=1978338 RepID=UPI000B437B1D|nr:MMPL family transporter [Bacillus sp. EAC]
MSFFVKQKYLVVAIWLVLAVTLSLLSPSLSSLVEEKGTLELPSSTQVMKAEKIQTQHGMDPKNNKSFAITFYNDQKLSESDKEAVKNVASKLEDNKDSIGLVSVSNSIDEPRLKNTLESKDGKTILLSGTLNIKGKNLTSLYNELNSLTAVKGLERIVTGKIFIDEQANKQNEDGLKKGIIIAGVLALVASLAVTRKPVVVLSALVLTLINYLVSASIYSFLVDSDKLPITNIAPLALGLFAFLLSVTATFSLYYRYAGVLSAQKSNEHSLIFALSKKQYSLLVSHAVFTVLSFGLLNTTFQMTKSLSVLIILGIVSYFASITFLPSLFSVFGKALLIPNTKNASFVGWQKWNSLVVRRSGIFTLVTLLVIAPIIAMYQHKVAYSTVDGLPNEGAAKGSRLVASEFSEGKSTPLRLVLENTVPWNTAIGMTSIEALSRSLSQMDGVESVRSASRPFSSELDPLLLVTQAATLKDGIGKGNDGVNQIREGLQGAKDELESSSPKLKEATDGIDQLVTGTTKLQTGVGKLEDGLSQIENGLRKGSVGAGQLHDGLGTAKDSTKQLLTGSKQLLAGYKEIEKNFKTLASGVGDIKMNLAKIQGGIQGSEQLASGLGKKYPEITSDTFYQQLQGTLKLLDDSLTEFIGKVGEAEKGAGLLLAGLQKANAGMTQVVDGQTKLVAGLEKLYAGMGELQNGIERAADGESLVLENVPQVTNGLGQLKDGQTQLGDGIGLFVDKVGELKDGLGQTVGGLTQIYDGLNTAQGYLGGLTTSFNPSLTGWYLPEEALSEPDFQKIFDNYMSKDFNVTTIDVTFEKTPISTEGTKLVDQARKTALKSLKDQGLESVNLALAEDPSTVYSLKPIITDDLKWLLTYSLIAAIVLFTLAYRNIFYSIISVGAATVTYFAGNSFAEQVFIRHHDQLGLKFLVPIFAIYLVFAMTCTLLAHLYSNSSTDADEKDSLLAGNIASMFAVGVVGSVIFVGLLFSSSYLFVQTALSTLVGLILVTFFIVPVIYPIFASKLFSSTSSQEHVIENNVSLTN